MFENWLTELSAENEFEIWSFSSDSLENISLESWIQFFEKAVSIRAQKVPVNTVYSSYIWFDEQALNLKLATTPYTKNSLPFGCSIELVESLSIILQTWLNAETYIPWEELEETNFEDNKMDSLPTESKPLKVWAVEHRE